MRKYKVVDLFCGVGGFSLGLQKSGFEVVAAYDNWEKSIDVYNSNFKNHACEKLDLNDVQNSVEKISHLEVDGIVGGPPCQDFSSAGKRKEGSRADLTRSFSEIIKLVKPTFFIMENVATAKNSESYKFARRAFISSGYSLSEVVLDASLYGVPQKRKRFFCVGILSKNKNDFAYIVEKYKNSEPMTIRKYFGKTLDTEFYYRHPRNYNRRAIYSIDEPAATVRGVNRPIPPNYPGHHLDAIGKKYARPLSTSERAQVQSFPNTFKWAGSKTDMEQMVGNAVPPKLAEIVGKSLLELLKKSQYLEAAE